MTVDEWIEEATDQLTNMSIMDARWMNRDAVKTLLANKPDSFSSDLAETLGMEDNAQAILHRVERLVGEEVDREEENVSATPVVKALAEALGLTDVQVDLIRMSTDPVWTARRELAAQKR